VLILRFLLFQHPTLPSCFLSRETIRSFNFESRHSQRSFFRDACIQRTRSGLLCLNISSSIYASPNQQATPPICLKITISTSSLRSRTIVGYTLHLLESQHGFIDPRQTAANPLPRLPVAIPFPLHIRTNRMPLVAMGDRRAIISRSIYAVPLSLRTARQDWQTELPMQRKCA